MARKVNRNFYEGLREALADARSYERGAKPDLRVAEFPAPPKPIRPREIRRIRHTLHASQAAFARFLCVSPKAVQSWEQGTRRPRNTALRLLAIAKGNPQVLLRD
jgi:DNA-binding transcriptional regulator YiaG